MPFEEASMSAATIPPSELASRVGTELGVSSWITVGQQRIDEFAHCTEDHQWIHVDVERARRESPFKDTIAHGYLTLALLAPTTFEILSATVAVKQAVNYGLDKVRFLAPVRAGKRVRNHLKVVAVEDKGGGRFLVTTENTVEIDGEDKPALIATALAMLMG
jgi:acyl dehydratase